MRGFLAGLATGAAIGLLYAPKSGRETREDLRSHGNDFVDAAQKHTERIKNVAVTVQEQFAAKAPTSAPVADGSTAEGVA
jgi:gas vesicle protein